MSSHWGTTPRESVAAECHRSGAERVVEQCVAILRSEQVDEGFLFVLAGPAARTVVDGREGGLTGYWPRTWALRALLYAWSGGATDEVVESTAHDSWRVREMAAKVIARHRVDEGLDAILGLMTDPIPRVRAAAERAKKQLTLGTP